MENIEIGNNLVNNTNNTDFLDINKIRYNVGEFISKNKKLSKTIRDFGSLGVTILSKLILQNFVSTSIVFISSFAILNQIIKDCEEYYRVKNISEHLQNASTEIEIVIERDRQNSNTTCYGA